MEINFEILMEMIERGYVPIETGGPTILIRKRDRSTPFFTPEELEFYRSKHGEGVRKRLEHYNKIRSKLIQ